MTFLGDTPGRLTIPHYQPQDGREEQENWRAVEQYTNASYSQYNLALTPDSAPASLGTGGQIRGFYHMDGPRCVGTGYVAFGVGGHAGTGTMVFNVPAMIPITTAAFRNHPVGWGYAKDASVATYRNFIVVPWEPGEGPVPNATDKVQLFGDGTQQYTDAVPFVWAAGDEVTFHFDFFREQKAVY